MKALIRNFALGTIGLALTTSPIVAQTQAQYDQARQRAAVDRQRQLDAQRAADRARQAEAPRRAADRARQVEAQRAAAERQRQLEAQRAAIERQRQQEAQRIAAEKARQQQLEAQRLVAERQRQLEAQRAAVERQRQQEAQRLAAEKARQQQLEAQRLATQRAQQLQAQRLAAYQAQEQAAQRQAATNRPTAPTSPISLAPGDNCPEGTGSSASRPPSSTPLDSIGNMISSLAQGLTPNYSPSSASDIPLAADPPLPSTLPPMLLDPTTDSFANNVPPVTSSTTDTENLSGTTQPPTVSDADPPALDVATGDVASAGVLDRVRKIRDTKKKIEDYKEKAEDAKEAFSGGIGHHSELQEFENSKAKVQVDMDKLSDAVNDQIVANQDRFSKDQIGNGVSDDQIKRSLAQMPIEDRLSLCGTPE